MGLPESAGKFAPSGNIQGMGSTLMLEHVSTAGQANIVILPGADHATNVPGERLPLQVPAPVHPRTANPDNF